jgi:methyltransferase (TIGR00027 family)
MADQQRVTQTALGPTFIVAVEQWTEVRERLVDDGLARRFLPGYGSALVGAARWAWLRGRLVGWSEQRYPGLWGELLCRKRYGDEQFVAAVAAGVRQVAVLGAGLDTRAYRELTPGVPPHTFEVDLPRSSEDKQRKLVTIFGRVPEHVELVAVDFETDDLERRLVQRGFDPEAPTLFIWEAVTQYLTPDAVRRTLGFLSRMARGSRLLFTYVRGDFLDGTNLCGSPALYRQFVAGKQPVWHFSLAPDDVGPLLGEFGWAEREQMARAEYLERYVRPLGRLLDVTEIERFVLADKA